MRIPEHNPALVDALKAARRTELQLEQERAKVRRLQHELAGVQRNHEHHLLRMIGMVQPRGAVDLHDPKPDLSAPVPLVISRASGGESANLWACPKCGSTYARREWAEDCRAGHAPKPCACGKTIRYDSLSKCDDCCSLGKLRKAKQVDEAVYEGRVYSDDFSGYRDGYFDSADEFRMEWEDHLEPGDASELPCFVWACREDKWEGIDAERIIESELEDHHEDATDGIVDDRELYEFLERWNAKQTLTTYYPDWDLVVVLDRARFEAMIAPNKEPKS